MKADCSGHGTGCCLWEPHPIPVFFPQLQTQHVSLQRRCHCSMFYPHRTQCCKNCNIPRIPVLGLTKELIKLHTLPKSCIIFPSPVSPLPGQASPFPTLHQHEQSTVQATTLHQPRESRIHIGRITSTPRPLPIQHTTNSESQYSEQLLGL